VNSPWHRPTRPELRAAAWTLLRCGEIQPGLFFLYTLDADEAGDIDAVDAILAYLNHFLVRQRGSQVEISTAKRLAARV